jgi:hypothetical protein
MSFEYVQKILPFPAKALPFSESATAWKFSEA